jgi:hypothetical protein
MVADPEIDVRIGPLAWSSAVAILLRNETTSGTPSSIARSGIAEGAHDPQNPPGRTAVYLCTNDLV